MSEFEPGRPGLRGVIVGPSLAAIPNSLAIQERYCDQWSRLWALSYNASEIVPNDTTMGWWLLAEFKTRAEARDYFNQLLYVSSGNTTMAARRRRTERRASWAPQCPECGGRVIVESPSREEDGGGPFTCDACGFAGYLGNFVKGST